MAGYDWTGRRFQPQMMGNQPGSPGAVPMPRPGMGGGLMPQPGAGSSLVSPWNPWQGGPAPLPGAGSSLTGTPNYGPPPQAGSYGPPPPQMGIGPPRMGPGMPPRMGFQPVTLGQMASRRDRRFG